MRRSRVFLLLLMLLLSPSIRGFICSEISQASLSDQFLPPPPPPEKDIGLLVTRDGTMHLFDAASQEVHWSLSSGLPIYSSYLADASKLNASGHDLYVDCGEDLQLYVHSRSLGRLRKLGLTADEFVRGAPFIEEDGGVTLGEKKTTIYVVDAKSGRLVQTYRLDDPPFNDRVGSGGERSIVPANDVGSFVEPGPVNVTESQQLVYITRTDYVLRYYSPETHETIWNVAFASIDAEIRWRGSFLSDGESTQDNLRESDLPFPHEKMVVIQVRDLKQFGWGDAMLQPSSSEHNPLLPPASILRLALPTANNWLALQPSSSKHNPLLLPASISPLALPAANRQLALTAPDYHRLALTAPDYHRLALTAPDYHRLALTAPDSGNATVDYMKPLITFITGLLPVVGLAFLLLRRNKLIKPEGESKVKAAEPKKKKPKRSGNGKPGANSDKKKNLISNEEVVEKSSGIEENGDKVLLTYPDLVEGPFDGRRIGKLHLSTKEIAKGSNGTVVLEGIYDGRLVAVKRLVRTHHDVALKEIQNLIASDQHPNIIRWYGVEYDQDFVYLSLERCNCSLSDFICANSETFQNKPKGGDSNFFDEYNVQLHSIVGKKQDVELWKANGHPSIYLLKLMRDVVSGLVHLHEIGIVHRDLKPQNVLIINERALCAKISDMGISKRLVGDMSSLTRNATGFGSSGWQAPEQLQRGRQTRAVDLFSLGCVLFFCITGGKHPYGDNIERDVNIVNDRKDLFLVEHIPEAVDLFKQLLDPNPEMRPKAEDVLHHPFFWTSEKRLSFLRDASDRIELEDREGESELLKALESTANVALNGKWDEKMEAAFINNIGRYRRYKYDSVRDLLRVIRNKYNHYRELPQEIQELLGPVPEGFDGYFSSRFPRLLIEVYKVFYRFCKQEEFFRPFRGSSIF